MDKVTDDQWIEISLGSGMKIDLEETLHSGQVFHFNKTNDNEYCGFVGEDLLILKQKNSTVLCKIVNEHTEQAVRNFFNLDILVDSQLCSVDGLRFLTNDLYSTIFSFICSQNNNVKRIEGMVHCLYEKGPYINYKNISVHKFPQLDELVDDMHWRAHGFGYRADYISQAAKYIREHQSSFTKEHLQKIGYGNAKNKLCEIKGIGRKVADCICLISLEYFDVVPIDRHIFNYSQSAFGVKINKLTKTTYNDIQRMWKERFGIHAGVAQLHIFKRYLVKK